MILEAIEGYIYTNKDRTLWGKVIALGTGDLALNYELVPLDKYDKYLKSLEEEIDLFL